MFSCPSVQVYRYFVRFDRNYPLQFDKTAFHTYISCFIATFIRKKRRVFFKRTVTKKGNCFFVSTDFCTEAYSLWNGINSFFVLL